MVYLVRDVKCFSTQGLGERWKKEEALDHANKQKKLITYTIFTWWYMLISLPFFCRITICCQWQVPHTLRRQFYATASCWSFSIVYELLYVFKSYTVHPCFNPPQKKCSHSFWSCFGFIIHSLHFGFGLLKYKTETFKEWLTQGGTVFPAYVFDD